MEEKQLDLNAPLLSVRRLSPARRNIDQIPTNSVAKSRPTRQQSLPASKPQWEPEQEVTKPAAIPFIWEQIPGQAKYRKTPNSNPPEPATNSPRLCSTINSNDEQPSEELLHPDAFDTLSMSYSSYSCNYSEDNSDAESLTSFGIDFNTREYLMNRFLPAAKSMIVETPQYVTKKQEPVPEPPTYVKKVYSGELRPLLLEKYPVNSLNQESDKECVVVDETKKKSGKKGFGLFFLPRICTRRSSCISNPMTGPKTKVHQSQSPRAESPGPAPGPIPRLSRRTSYSGPLTPSLEKQAMDAVIKKRAESRPKEAHETQHKSNPFTRSGNSLPSSPHRSLSRSGRSISPYRNESPRSPFHDGARFLGVPKDVQNRIAQPKTCPSLNVKSHFSPRLIHDSPPVVPEKTLYIDWNEKSTSPTPQEAKIETDGDVDGSVRVPPLPKSPSESWLRRKMSLRSHFPKKMQPVPIEKSPKSGPKWETIVKTSNVHHDHVRYSEELLNVSKYSEISF
ncbi:hypothetical protein HanXRQr2_Chr16g0758061 [Helianthus annuus]|uniref:Uncharacterized protein n=1 Tax=Helianthus annuus TaxID=4232 RepID=A0A251S0F3_HELAN|nr:uncharacterized protein LOC110915283 [Helianthus annuus]XP_022015651.1 uncharacterized protein LOC110915283 [Helianthus annuus]KAF5760836.1 hypothetical protein HanXRQr2_Chr16g0758061 [Helianthus annuus]KAJ0438801.1 hypothetical protein HanHA300_Chr16g0618201 [Helianthus annuus]KAJ0641574.1 hypothetical protein HanLR1_Chr16g0628761 [Helianthus annuus]